MAQTTVTTSPTLLSIGATGAMVLRNRGVVAIYVGFDNTVTAATGYQVDPNEALSISRTLPATQPVWAITATSTALVHILAGGV